MTDTHSLSRAQRDVPVLYLDLDGTVRHGPDELGRFVNGPQDVIVFPEAVTMMRAWRDRGGRIVAVSNQGGVALGYVAEGAVREAMVETHVATGGLFDHLMACAHHPAATDPARARCWCRKPKPGMIVMAATMLSYQHPQEHYPPHLALMVGDRDEDRLCAEAADIDFLHAEVWRSQACQKDGAATHG